MICLNVFLVKKRFSNAESALSISSTFSLRQPPRTIPERLPAKLLNQKTACTTQDTKTECFPCACVPMVHSLFLQASALSLV